MACDRAEAVCSEGEPAEGLDGHIEYPWPCQSRDEKESPSLLLRKEPQPLLSEKRAGIQRNGWV